jgi:hypothetical protein
MVLQAEIRHHSCGIAQTVNMLCCLVWNIVRVDVLHDNVLVSGDKPGPRPDNADARHLLHG